MCGLVGVFNHRGHDVSALLSEMIHAIRYRGPDDSGVWCDPSIGFGLGHARLSILDLSSAGHQPMLSASGRYILVFNGEIYNHLEIREQLGRLSWRGHSDTETLLAAFETWGVQKTLQISVGMFALALWDRTEQRLILARDRMGEKPLYYGWIKDTFVFASELKALEVYPGWKKQIDRAALACFMRLAYVPVPHSIYVGIRKLLPGTYAMLSSAHPVGYWPEPQTYWSSVAVVGQDRQSQWTEEVATEELSRLLRMAIRGQMAADVPLGAFLSGGVDSSTVVALMQAQSSRSVKTFSIGFLEDDYNEAPYAKAVANHLGTEHTELYVSSTDAQAVIPSLPSIYDEPFADVSAIPMYLVSMLAKQSVTVVLSGDGGDESFGGYNRYFWGPRLWSGLANIPLFMRSTMARAMTAISPEQWDVLGKLLRAGLSPRLSLSALGDKVHKLAGIIDSESQDEFSWRLISQQHDQNSVVIGAQESMTWAESQSKLLMNEDFSSKMMFRDLVGYLTDDILVKLDRASMAASLETRVPFLDQRIVEFAWTLPLSMKIRSAREGKWLLRRVLYRHVPKQLIERPKMGFGVPLDSWLRNDLREWAESLLDESRLRREGYLHPAPIRRKWSEHLSGSRNWQYFLWNVLMFQAWLERRQQPQCATSCARADLIRGNRLDKESGL